MGVTVSSGIFSGIETAQLIEQLMAVEQQPLASLNKTQAAFEAKISAFGGLKSAVSTLKTNLGSLKKDTIFAMSAKPSDTSILTASAKSTASVGNYSIVVNQLATSQSLYSEIFSSSTSAVADLSSVATQKLKIQVGSATAKTITIDSTNNTVAGIKDAINAANAGATASLVNVGFVIDSTNNTLVFNDGSNRTATLTAGTYTGDALATEIKTALEAANAGSDTYTVTYDASTKKFKIANDTGNANAVDFLFENASTTSEGILGFNTTDHASVAVGASVTSDNGVDGVRLVLSADATGTANRIVLTVDEDNDGVFEEATSETDTTGLSKLAFKATYDSAGAATGGTRNLTQSQASIDASLDVNGLTITRSSNTISDIITDVTLDLVSAPTTKPTVTLTLSKDLASIADNIDAFVGAYNRASGLGRSLSDGKDLLLTGDSTARGIVTSLRSVITTSFKGNIPASFGLSHSKEGVLSLDSAVLDKAIDNDLQGVIDTFDAMAESLEDTLDDYVKTLIPARVNGLNSSVDRTKDRIESLGRRLITKEETFRRQFSALEETLSTLQAGGDFLTQQLSAISNINKKT
ncbi:MAG: flagellar filament capping protein FliD [Nitrospiria bacterium]